MNSLASIQSPRALKSLTTFASPKRVDTGRILGSPRHLSATIARPHRRTLTTSRTMHGSSHSVPADAWDSHMHVLEPGYALAAGAVYEPHTALLADAQASAARLCLPNLVFVQASPHGTDNACQLDALARHGLSRGRAVVVFDPEAASDAQLRDLHARGARGVRVNLKSVGREMGADELAALLRRFAERVRPLGGWSVHVYVDLRVVPQLERVVVGGLGVPLVVDHMGGPPRAQADMAALPGWDALLRLLERPGAFVKVSAPYRFTPGQHREEFREFEPMVRALLRARGGTAALFASDWPHTRHEYTDVEPWVQRCLEWCGDDETLRNNLFRDNARRLWGAAD